MPEPRKRKPRTNFERLVRDTAQYCRISIRVLNEQAKSHPASGDTASGIKGQIAAYETVLRELRMETQNGGSE